GRVRDARPSRPSRRGDLGRGPVRAAPAHLGAGREPPSRPEGAARAAGRLRMSEPARTAAEGASAGQMPGAPPAAQVSAPGGGAARPRPGDELELQVESLAFGGEGVARLGEGGYVVFVAGAVPGDRVRAVVYKRKRSYAHARTVDVLDPSPERIPARAAHPGVTWQVLPYGRHLEAKREQVEEGLEGGDRGRERRGGDEPDAAKVARAGRAPGARRPARSSREPGPGPAPDGRARLRNLVVREGRRSGQLQIRIVTTEGELDAG